MKKEYLLLLLFAFACTAEQPGTLVSSPAATGNGTAYVTGQLVSVAPASLSLELSPKHATRKSTLNLVAQGFNLAAARIDWLVNGSSFTTQLPNQFNCADAAKGSAIRARAVVDGREVLSDSVQIENAPPVLANVKLVPEVFKPGDTLGVEATGADSDGDPVTISYAWTKNGEPAGNGRHIDCSVKRGDTIAVSLTPSDGQSAGEPLVLTREIENSPPLFTEHQDFTFANNVYTYQARATDADGDAIAYSLESPVDGMTIDASTGLLMWNVPADFSGRKNIALIANDGHGGTARYGLGITIQ